MEEFNSYVEKIRNANSKGVEINLELVQILSEAKDKLGRKFSKLLKEAKYERTQANKLIAVHHYKEKNRESTHIFSLGIEKVYQITKVAEDKQKELENIVLTEDVKVSKLKKVVKMLNEGELSVNDAWQEVKTTIKQEKTQKDDYKKLYEDLLQKYEELNKKFEELSKKNFLNMPEMLANNYARPLV